MENCFLSTHHPSIPNGCALVYWNSMKKSFLSTIRSSIHGPSNSALVAIGSVFLTHGDHRKGNRKEVTLSCIHENQTSDNTLTSIKKFITVFTKQQQVNSSASLIYKIAMWETLKALPNKILLSECYTKSI
jgi:hypothetical protein